MHKGIFITGTDTDVGKTIVTAGLLNLLRTNGVDAVPMKPVQTGCVLRDGIQIPYHGHSSRRNGEYQFEHSFSSNKNRLTYNAPDLDFVLSCAGLTSTEEEYKHMSPYRYEPACSPHLAGRMVGDFPDIEHIVLNLKKLEKNREFILVEGAGGIMVPLNDNDMMLDLMKVIGYPVILVSHTGLGTINHTLLSIQVLRNAGIDIMGVIFNNTQLSSEASEFIRKDNVKTIAERGRVNVLGVVDYFDDIQNNFDMFKDSFNKAIDYDTINRLIGN
jgi:dethiobiotin synthase